MIKTEDLQLAAALAQSLSLSAAARALNVTPPALSMRLRKLEATLGATLATRTARRLQLTPEGERLAQQASILLAQLQALPEFLRGDDSRLTGTLRIAAPFGYGRHRLAPSLARFARLHPELRLQLDLRESPWHDRHDADVVVHVGAVKDSNWIARTLADNERWLCASPAYIERHGMPATPRQLPAHACICIRENEDDITLWSYRRQPASPGDKPPAESVRVAAALLTNDGSTARFWAEQGLGIALRSRWDLVEAMAAGTLVRLLPDFQFSHAPIVMLLPTRLGRSARVEALRKFLEAEAASHASAAHKKGAPRAPG
jgi:DNA-binding transcriptional LysR family regulator